MMGANYGRRKEDNGFNISMFPKWMNIIMIVCKWLICMIPFIICSFMLFFTSEITLWDNWLLTAVYLLSLGNVVNCLND